MTPPSPAPVLNVTEVKPRRVSLSWTASTDNATQAYYTLLVNGGQTYVANQIGAFTATVLELTSSTAYTFTVTARDSFGNAVQSNASAPPNLRAGSETGGCEAWLSWDASADDSDHASALRYDVYVNGEVAVESSTIGYTSTIAYARAVGTNTFLLKAVDTSGNVSAASKALTFTDMAPC